MSFFAGVPTGKIRMLRHSSTLQFPAGPPASLSHFTRLSPLSARSLGRPLAQPLDVPSHDLRHDPLQFEQIHGRGCGGVHSRAGRDKRRGQRRLRLARRFPASGGHPPMLGQDVLCQIVRRYLHRPTRRRSGAIRFAAAVLRLLYMAVLLPELFHSRRWKRRFLFTLIRLTRLRDIPAERRDDISGPKHSRRLRSPVAVYLFHSCQGLLRTHNAMPQTARLCHHPCHPIIPPCGVVLPENIFVVRFLSTLSGRDARFCASTPLQLLFLSAIRREILQLSGVVFQAGQLTGSPAADILLDERGRYRTAAYPR